MGVYIYILNAVSLKLYGKLWIFVIDNLKDVHLLISTEDLT